MCVRLSACVFVSCESHSAARMSNTYAAAYNFVHTDKQLCFVYFLTLHTSRGGRGGCMTKEATETSWKRCWLKQTTTLATMNKKQK